MKRPVLMLAGCCVLAAAFADAAAKYVVPLWPEGKIPDYSPAQNAPSLEVTVPAGGTNTSMLIIAPGGSYRKWCAWESRCADYFNRRGLATAVLKYRTPRSESGPKHLSAWQDAQRAVRICRARIP